MDIHLDRWLEHLPMPPDMPNGEARQLPRDARQRSAPRVVGRVGRSARLRAEDGGLLQAVQHRQERRRAARSDRRARSSPSWSARGSACGAARSPPAGTSGIRSRGPRSSRCSAPTRRSTSSRSGSTITSVERIERFTQSIGDRPFSEIELAMPGATIDDQVDRAVERVRALHRRAARRRARRRAARDHRRRSSRSRCGSAAARSCASARSLPGVAIDEIAADVQRRQGRRSIRRLGKLVGALGEGIARVEYGRAGERAGVDVYVEPTDAATRAPGRRRRPQAN